MKWGSTVPDIHIATSRGMQVLKTIVTRYSDDSVHAGNTKTTQAMLCYELLEQHCTVRKKM